MHIFTPDGKSLVFYEDKQLVLRDVVTGAVNHTIDLSLYNLSTYRGNFSPDGLKLLLLDSELAPRLLDVATGEELRVFVHADYKRTIWGLISHDGRSVLVSDPDDDVFHWDIETHSVVQRYHHEWKLLDFAVSRDNRYLVGGGEWSEAGVWDIESGKQLHTIPSKHFLPEIGSVVLLPDDQHALLCDGTTGLIVHLPSGQVHELASGDEFLIVNAAVAQDANLLITNAYDAVVSARLWDATSWEQVGTLPAAPGQDDNPGLVDISRDGRYAVTVPYNQAKLYVWDMTHRVIIHQYDFHG